jgi:hypothetical protein
MVKVEKLNTFFEAIFFVDFKKNFVADLDQKGLGKPFKKIASQKYATFFVWFWIFFM